MGNYWIRISRPLPSFEEDKREIEASSYKEAVEMVRKIWQDTKRHITLHSSEFDVYYWYRIDSAGNAHNRNSNAGVA